MEEGKGQGGLATSHQYGNALLGVCYQEEEEEVELVLAASQHLLCGIPTLLVA